MKTSALVLSLLVSCSAPALVTAGHFKTSPVTISQSVADLQDYVGTYRIADLSFDKIVVTTQNGKLHYVAGEYEGDFAEVSGKADTFSAHNGEATVTFVRNTEGKVDRLRLQIPDGTFEATKEMATTASLSDYAGRYKLEGLDFDHVDLTVKNGQIHFIGGDNQGVFTPIAGQADTFDASGQARVKFERNAKNKITRMIVEVDGQTFSGVPVAQ